MPSLTPTKTCNRAPCTAQIARFEQTDPTRPSPLYLDLDPVPDGNVVIRDGRAKVLTKIELSMTDALFPEDRYVVHQRTCIGLAENRPKDPPFPRPDPRRDRTRRDDGPTSTKGADSVSMRAGSQKHLLLIEYGKAGQPGLTNDEAGLASGLANRRGCCYWKRCGELLTDGYIAPTGTPDRPSPISGDDGRVCAITDLGRSTLAALPEHERKTK